MVPDEKPKKETPKSKPDEHAGHAHAKEEPHKAEPRKAEPKSKPDEHAGHAHAKEEPRKAEPRKEAPKAAPAPAKPAKAHKLEEAKVRAEEASARGKGKKAPEKKDDVKIVESAQAAPAKHVARAKPTLAAGLKAALALRRVIDHRRPTFKHQQWYEYKRLENLGWRRPNGVDSAMRRHFGYEQSVVRVGFRGPTQARGLHPSGFQEVAVMTIEDLAQINPKTQAARVGRTLGTRKLKLLYEAAEKKGIRVLNRRKLE